MKTRTVLFLLLYIPTVAFSQTFNIMTYNIRYDNPADGNNSWSFRKESLVNQIEKSNPAIFGIQEGLHHQVLYLDSCLTKFSYVGVGRDDGKTKGEYSAIFYDTTQFSVIETSTFWLSKTPNKVSVGWNASMERICTYALLQHKNTGKRILVYNTHFDHIGVKARKNSAKLLVSRISEPQYAGIPVVLMGDFNDVPFSEPIKQIKKEMKDSDSICTIRNSGPKGTFNAFDNEMPIEEKIDFIFVKNLEVISCHHINEMRPDGFFISDHLPVVVCVKMF